jgi:predicted nuclease with RNAse H fold
MRQSILAIGWDVRGWRGKQQAVAVIRLDLSRPKSEPEWWVSDDFQFKPGEPLDLKSLIRPALGDKTKLLLKDADRVVIGIDAPLAFPGAIKDLLNDADAQFAPSTSEIENPLAYRDCERWVYREHGKKPLSASFDKLGNGATLALALCAGLRREGFRVLPQDADTADRAVIEVYPAIVKREARRVSAAVDDLHRLLPAELSPGTDQYDAALCALVAAVHAGAGEHLGLPELVGFQPGFDRAEGWVYSFAADYIGSLR